jgi:hypothetical protein
MSDFLDKQNKNQMINSTADLLFLIGFLISITLGVIIAINPNILGEFLITFSISGLIILGLIIGLLHKVSARSTDFLVAIIALTVLSGVIGAGFLQIKEIAFIGIFMSSVLTQVAIFSGSIGLFVAVKQILIITK